MESLDRVKIIVTLMQYFTVPHIVHRTLVDNDRTFAQFCINFNYYYLILSI